MSEVTDRREPDAAQQGAIARALLWVVGGLVLAVLAFVAVTPEVAGSEPGILVELVGIVGLAAVPGIVLLVVFAIRRQRLGLDGDPAERSGSEAHPRPHPDQDR
jgi:hypothetical protein